MANYSRISNMDLWNDLRNTYPQFKSVTSKGTLETFTERGWEQLHNTAPDLISNFYDLSLRVYLQIVNISQAIDPLNRDGFGEYFDQPRGGYIQRMAVNTLKPISPAWNNLVNGQSVDPFVVRKPVTNERIFAQNFDYCSLLTIPDEYAMKQIFISEFGMSEFMAGLMKGLENGYIIQKYENKLEAINAGINSTNYPLLDTQKVTVEMNTVPTESDYINLILAIRNTISAMTLGPQSSGFNAIGFSTIQEKDRLKLLVRPGFKNDIAVMVERNSYNADTLNIGIDIIEVPHFGGLQPYKEAEFTTPLYPVYDTLGTQIGFTETSGGTTVTVENADVFWKDPNENVVALLADKGYIFESVQNPYRVEAIRNPRGLYTNYWATSPNNAICVDHLYNVVEILKTTTPAS